jgi:uncharacterized protein YgiM (DUF1202 family)
MAANRRVVLKAAAGVAALAASGIGAVPQAGAPVATAQEVGGTRATRFVPDENGISAADAAQGEWVSFQADYPFWALGASWNGDVGTWPIIALQFSEDGSTWTETIDVAANTEDGGQPNRDGRLFTPLVFTDGVQWVRYQTIDSDRRAGEIAGLSFVYIDPTDGPWEEDILPESGVGAFSLRNEETLAPPEIITRAQWGANEAWRRDTYGEIWSPEYETVTHLIIHHTATANRPADVPGAIRSIYYYHAVEQGWGDIGYNYLVDHNGRIYQGRYGGQDVIGGHSFQFAIGSSGISTIGNFMNVDISVAAKSALVSICAWVGRDLDPLGTEDFHEAPDLPIISSHRDVNSTTCPGDRLWNDLPELRQLVAQTLDAGVLETDFAAGIVPGDRVRVQTDSGSALNLRGTANGSVTGSLANNATAWVIDGPEQLSNGNWYQVQATSNGATGWATAEFLIVDPPLPPGSPSTDYPFGLNLRILDTVNVRRSPSQSAGIVGMAARNTWAHVMAIPVDAEGWEWYPVRVEGVGDGWVVSTAIAPAPLVENPAAAKFKVGDTVVATESLNIRPRPGIPQRPIATAGAGTSFVISQPPLEVTGYIWYGVYSQSRGGGWVVENYLRASAPPPAGKFTIGDTFRITQSTNLRSNPTTSASVLLTMSTGATGTVFGGPRTANGYTWWQVRHSNGTSGWCIQNWMVETDGGTTPPPTGKFAIGDRIRVTERMNLRASAGTSASVVTILQVGVTGTVLAGPSTANGYTWWRIQTSAGTGWAVQDWMLETDGGTTPPPTGKFVVGDRVRVTERLNLRSGASTAGSVIAVLQVGVTGEVLSGPSTGSGYTWWRIRTSAGTGWAVQDWLAKTTGTNPPEEPEEPTGRFEAGDAIRITESANFRTGAGTSNSVISVLTVGATGTIVSGPTTASGYTWWQIRTGGRNGWVIDDVLEAGSGTTPPPSSGGYPAGTVVFVIDPNLRMRASASTSSSILAVLPQNHRLTIVSGPTSAGGYNWYRVTSATYGSGYVVSEFIDEV